MGTNTKKCRNCGKTFELPEDSQDHRTKQLFCRECAANFTKAIVDAECKHENGELLGPHEKIMPNEVNEFMTSWNPKTHQGTRPQKPKSETDTKS